MAQEAAVPRGWRAMVQKMIDDAIARYARSGPLRNASITSGGLTIQNGVLRILYPEDQGGGAAVYYGNLVNAITGDYLGTGMLVQKPDGTDIASFSWDADTDTQTAHLHDDQNAVIVSNDKPSGRGLARPFGPIPVTRARYTDMIAVTDAAFVDVIETPGMFHKVHAKARADIRSTTDEAATTGEIRVLVDGVQVGTTLTVGFLVSTQMVGPFTMPGDAYSTHQIKIQARRTAGAGAVRLDAAVWGVQS